MRLAVGSLRHEGLTLVYIWCANTPAARHETVQGVVTESASVVLEGEFNNCPPPTGLLFYTFQFSYPPAGQWAPKTGRKLKRPLGSFRSFRVAVLLLACQLQPQSFYMSTCNVYV